MKTISNKKGIRNEAREILRLNNYFNTLGLNEVDSELQSFFNYNFNLFNSRVNKGVKVGLTPNKLVRFINESDNSIFEVEFVPNMMDPEYINVRLTNLNGNLDQVYRISFDEFNDLVTIKYTKFLVSTDGFKGNISSNKTTIESIYDNGILRSQKVNQFHIGKGVYDDSSITKDQMTYYCRFNDDYVRHTIVIGETGTKNGETYEYFDGKKSISISKEVFEEKSSHYESDLPKVKIIDSF